MMTIEDPIIPVSVKAMMGRFERAPKPVHQFRFNHNKPKPFSYAPPSKVIADYRGKENTNNNYSPPPIDKPFFPKVRGTRSIQNLDESSRGSLDRESSSNRVQRSKTCFSNGRKYENISGQVYKSDVLLTPEVRTRSRSVGSFVQDEEELSDKEKTTDNEHNSSNFSSFTEKQKLVESIVMNIKNSGQKESNGKDQEKSPTLMLTSKLEKDLKNALEKGVRRWSVKCRRPKSSKPGSVVNSLPEKTFDADLPHSNAPFKYQKQSKPKIELKPEIPSSLNWLHEGHISRSLLSPQEPVRPPRRKSPRKILSNSGMQTTSLEIEDDPGPTYSTISRDRFKSSSPFPEGEPPKKPPRTYAHDIYMSGKKEDINKGFQSDQWTNKNNTNTSLSQDQIDSLYSKPIKKQKPKFSIEDELPSPPNQQSKPTLAPKPPSLVNADARKRFSIVEPSSKAEEFSEAKKSAVKRNSSFRFSFRKPKLSPTYLGYRQPQPNSPKKDHKSRNENNKKVRFSHRSKSDEILYNDDRIYATPQEEFQQTQTEPELHYMCSPLFQDDEWTTDSEATIIPPPDASPKVKDIRAKFGLEGLKQEWRQSYRFVQKRLKKLNPPDKSQ